MCGPAVTFSLPSDAPGSPAPLSTLRRTVSRVWLHIAAPFVLALLALAPDSLRVLQAGGTGVLNFLLPGAAQPAAYSPLQVKTAAMLASLLDNLGSAPAMTAQLAPWLAAARSNAAAASVGTIHRHTAIFLQQAFMTSPLLRFAEICIGPSVIPA